jgi:eukaryotic-like serine/threonine-protein kinase
VEDRTVFQPFALGSVRPGVRLNGIYEIVAFVTQGGMGEVYRGFNIQTGDPVAIKMIRPELSNNPDVLELFKREAKTLHKLAHEAIVRYFVFTIDPDTQRAYLAMEFVEGPSLTNRFESGPLPLADVKILQMRIGSALEAAHRLGIIHRDISPDNIILPDGDVRNAKVIDFGIARSRRRAEVTIIGGGFAGKYNYASPEQFGLAGGDVTFKSDIYSFGLVLAAALCGRPIDMSGSEVEAIAKRRAVPDLSDIDPTIRPLIRAMLQPLPADRPASMAAVAAWEPGGGGSAASPAPSVKRAFVPQSGRVAAMLGAVIALASVGGAAYVFRDEIGRWEQVVMAPTAPSGLVKPPIAAPSLNTQIPPLTPPPSDHGGAAPPVQEPAAPAPTPTTGAQTETHLSPSTEIASKETPNSPAQHVPTSGELLDALPPRAPQPVVELPAASVGEPYRAAVSPFADPGGKGLRLAANGLPDGMTFSDLGEGRGEIKGTPTHAGSAALQVVATNHNGKTAQVSARIDIENKTEKATVESNTTDSTPPASRTDQTNPAAGTPQSPQISLAPSETTQPLGAVEKSKPPAPAVQESELNPPLSQREKAKAFLAAFHGGDCFLVKPRVGAAGPNSYQAFGRGLEPFQRFDLNYKTEVGAEADLRAALVTAEECPALDLIRLGTADGAPPLRIELTNYGVGRGKPLAGAITNLAGRHLYLILVDNAGVAHRLDAKMEAGGGAAFSVPLTPDADSIGPTQILLAIASSTPVPAVEAFREGRLTSLAPQLVQEARAGSMSVEADYFKFVK